MNQNLSYDKTFFRSKLHRGRHIESIHTTCLSNGISTEAPFNARVLEIGCATGHALFPLAVEYPQAQFVGIDPSRGQIDEAKKTASELGLQNIDFRCGNIFSVLEETEKFDYILCHGVISWVSNEAQEEIFKGITRHLSALGVALVSFNVAPGAAIRTSLWESLRSMIGSVSNIKDARSLIEDYRSIIEFDYERPYQVLLYQELTRILSESDSYLVHEVLATENSCFSYRSFEEICNKHDLIPVADVRPHRNGMNRLHSAHVPDEAYTAFSRLQKRGLSTDSLLDASSGTPFREMIITSKDTVQSEGPHLEQLYSMSFALAACQILEPEDSDDQNCTIRAASGRIEKISHPLLKSLLVDLASVRPCFCSFSSLQQKFPSEEPMLLARALAECISREIVLAAHYPPSLATTVLAHPKTSAYIRLQSRDLQDLRFANLVYETIEVDALAAKFLQHLDGQTDKDALKSLVRVWLASGEGSIKADGVIVDDLSEIEQNLPILVESTLETLRKGGLLLP